MNCAEMMRSKSSSKPKDAMRLKSEDIGAPLNFNHVVHVAPRPLVSVNLNDPHIQAFLQQAGVTEDQLSNLAVYETIVNFINVHGVDEVKKEVADQQVVGPSKLAPVDTVDSAVPAEIALEKIDVQDFQGEDETKKQKIDASPSFISRIFKGKKKSSNVSIHAKEEKELKEASTSQIVTEAVETLDKEVDEGVKLLAVEEEGKKGKKKFFFSKEIKEENNHPPEEKSGGSFFSLNWGRKESDAKKRKAEETAEPKKTAGIFKRNLKKTRVGSTTSSSSEDDETINLKPDGDEETIETAPEVLKPTPIEKKRNFFRNKTKKSASVDELQLEKKRFDNIEGKETSSDDEGKKISSLQKQKKELFRIKGKNAVSVDVHQEVVAEEVERIENSPVYAQVQKTSRFFGQKSKRESSDSYDKLDNQEEFDEAFKKEAENASKLNIIPNLTKTDSSQKKKTDGEKTSTLDRHSTGSGFFKFGSLRSSKRGSAPVERVPEAPISTLPEENKHKVKKYKVHRIAQMSSASLNTQSAGDVTSSDEHSDGKHKAKRRPRKTKKGNKPETGSDAESPPGMFRRIFSRRSASETRESKKQDRIKKQRRSSLDATPVKEEEVKIEENLKESVEVLQDPIYENFPPKGEEDEKSKSTDEEADEYYAQYHQEKKQVNQARRSWSFVMAELKEKITSFDEEDLGEPERLVFQLKMVGDEEGIEGEKYSTVRLQQMKSDPSLADRRSSTSSEDELEKIKRSVEKLDNDYFEQKDVKEVSESVSVIQPKVSKEILPTEETEVKIEVEKPPEDKSAIPNLEKIRPTLPLPIRVKMSDASSSSEDQLSPDQITSPSSSGQNPLSPSDALETDSREGSVRSPLSLDSLDSNQNTNNNEDDVQQEVILRSSLVRQGSSLVSNSESRPLSDRQLKIADTIEVEDEQPPVIRQVVPKQSGRRLERGSRVSKRPTSSMSSSNEESGSLPNSPVQKEPQKPSVPVVEEPIIRMKVRRTSSSSSDSSSKGDSIPSSTEDLTVKQGSDKENLQTRRESINDDVFETESLTSKRTSVERNASYHRAVEKSGSLPLPRKNGQPGRRSSSNASRIPRPILKKPRRRTVDNWPSTHKVTEL
ncbi:uncharacterized protein LOC132204792 [Neocloeon triangulifer]|uniref:uncharacterized protein LOC132204792 n=1 Tax=Neocloeon triangulifer TaxID=2078957 RepID=UPI00286EB737|nr:uncharacterized protein LOC132204792 [Neocloeon triangulifer]